MNSANQSVHVRSRIGRAVGLLVGAALVLTGLITIPSSTLAAGPLSMTGFKPISGPVGTVVTITGAGFRSGDIVAFNGTPAVASTATKKGTKLKASVPAFATSGPITVTDPATGQTVGLPGTVFQVSAGLFASPDHVWAGGNVTISGSALPPDQSEPIDLGKVVVGEAQTDADGDFNVGIVVPWNIPSGSSKFSVVSSVGRFTFPIDIFGSWPSFRHDSSHVGVQSYETALKTTTVGGLTKLWGYTAGSVVYSSPAVANGVVYVGSDDAKVYALNAVTGAVEWTYTTGDAINSSPAVANGVVYIGSSDNNVYALNAATGAVEWTFATGNTVNSSPDVANGIVYVGSEDDYVYALNAATGALAWKYNTGDQVDSSPAVANGIVYVGSAANDLFALNASTGTLDWAYGIDALGNSSPAVASGMVYIGSGNESVYALNATTGAFVWSYDTGQPIGSSPAVANGVVYIGSANDDIYALKGSTGALVWSYTTGFEVISSPAVANGVVYFGSLDDNLYALNAANGTKLWSANAGLPVGSSPAVANGVVYVGCNNGNISAYGL